jgi:hypothetical protein
MRARVRTDFTATPGRPFEQAILPHMMAATICADGIFFIDALTYVANKELGMCQERKSKYHKWVF